MYEGAQAYRAEREYNVIEERLCRTERRLMHVSKWVQVVGFLVIVEVWSSSMVGPEFCNNIPASLLLPSYCSQLGNERQEAWHTTLIVPLGCLQEG